MRDLETNAHTCTNSQTRPHRHRALSPCQKNPGRGLWAVRTETDRLSHTPLSRDGWWEFPYRSLRPTQTVKNTGDVTHWHVLPCCRGLVCSTYAVWERLSLLHGLIHDLMPIDLRTNQISSEGASAATNLHRHSSFLAELDCDTGWCAPTRWFHNQN